MAFKEAAAKSDDNILDDYMMLFAGMKSQSFDRTMRSLEELKSKRPGVTAQKLITWHFKLQVGIQSFGSFTRMISRYPDLTLPTFLPGLIVDAYHDCVDTAAVRGLLRAIGVRETSAVTDMVTAGEPDSEERDAIFMKLASNAVARDAKSDARVAPIYALELLGETRLARSLAELLESDLPTPNEASRTGVLRHDEPRAAVVVRRSDLDNLKTSIDVGSKRPLTLDAVYLAEGLSRHELWDLVFADSIYINRILVKSARVEAEEKDLVVTWMPAGRDKKPIVSRIPRRIRRAIKNTQTDPLQTATVAVLASMFSTVEKLEKTHSSIDREILQKITVDTDSVTSIYRYSGYRWWEDRGRIAKVTHSASASHTVSRDQHDVRGHQRYIGNGTVVWVRPHKRGSKHLK